MRWREALVLAGWLASAARAEPSREGGLRLTPVPAQAVLGEAREVEVRVELPPETDAAGVEVFVSEGEVGPLTRVAPGLLRAPYVPPRERLPREVLFTVLARGPRGPLEGWGVLALWGQGEAEVRTRPHAPVTLQVGGRSFGPVRADAKGLAHVPLTVPPGHTEALFGARRIDLGVPPWPWVHAVAARRRVRADRAETVDVRLYHSRLEGTPAPPGPFVFTVTRGEVSAPRELEPGVVLVRWTVPPGPVGALELQGGAGGDARWSVDVRLEAVPGPPPRPERRREVPVPPPPRPARVTLAPHVGGMTNFADVRAPALGVRLEVWPVRAWPALGLMLDTGALGYWRGGTPGVPDFSGQTLVVATTVAVGLRSPPWHGLRGWVAAGVAAARVRGRSVWGGGLSLAEATWVPGAQALVGLGVALGPGEPFLEARGCWFDDPALHVLRGALGGAGLHMGYRLELF